MKNVEQIYIAHFFIIFSFFSVHTMNIEIDETEYAQVIERYKISKIKEISWDSVPEELFKTVCSGKYGPNICDRNNISLFLYLMMHRTNVPLIIKFLESNNNKVDLSSTDTEGNGVLYWFKKNFYEFEKEYAEIALLLKNNGADIDFSIKSMKFNNFFIDDWSNVSCDLQKKIMQDPYLYMNVVDKAHEQTVLMYWLRNPQFIPKNLNILTIINNKDLIKKRDKNGNTIAHCAYENYFILLQDHAGLLNTIKNLSIMSYENNDKKKPSQMIPIITIKTWKNLDSVTMKFLESHPNLLISGLYKNTNKTVDKTYGETYLIYLLRTFEQEDTLSDFLKKHKNLITKVINVQDALGNTALHYAYEKKYSLDLYAPKIIDTLLECGASTTIKNNDGLTPDQITPLRDNIISFWTDDLVKKALNYPDIIFNVTDSNWETALIYLVRTINLNINKIFYEYTEYRPSFSFNDVKKVIAMSNVNSKNQDGYTALDYLLIRYAVFDIFTDGLFIDGWRWKTLGLFNEDSQRYKRPLLLFDLITEIFYKGYDFEKNTQTTLDLLPKNFLYENVFHLLINAGINFGNKQFDASAINTKITNITEYSALSNKTDEEVLEFLCDQTHKEYLSPIFCYALAHPHKKTRRMWTTTFPKTFSLLKTLELAAHNNGYKSFSSIMKNFSNPTLMNVMCAINNKKIPYTLKDETHKKIYELYKSAQEKGNHVFCEFVQNYSKLKWVLSKKPYSLIPKEIKNNILKYL